MCVCVWKDVRFFCPSRAERQDQRENEQHELRDVKEQMVKGLSDRERRTAIAATRTNSREATQALRAIIF